MREENFFNNFFLDRRVNVREVRSENISAEESATEIIKKNLEKNKNPFLICYYKALNSVAFKSLDNKAQAFVCVTEDLANYILRMRIKHTMEVVAISRIIAETLGLNVVLVETIALLHDVGHLPFGHLGEQEFSKITGKKMRHNVIATIILQEVENFGKGLSLSKQVLEGIYYHSAGAEKVVANKEIALEYAVVLFADKIAYLFADISDAIRINGKISNELILLSNDFGRSRLERIDTCIYSLFLESCEKKYIDLSTSKIGQKFQELKDLLYREIYKHADKDEDRSLLQNVLNFLKNNQNLLPIDYQLFFALMNDANCRALSNVISGNKMEIEKCLYGMAAMEIGCNLPKNFSSLDLTKPVLF